MLTDQMLRLVDSKLVQVRRQLNQNKVNLLKLARSAHDCENLLGINIPSQVQLKKLAAQPKDIINNAVAPDDLTQVFDAEYIKKSYKDPLEISDYITCRLLLDKSNASIKSVKLIITQALDLYAEDLNAERNQATSSSRSQINLLNQQLNTEKNSTKGADRLRSVSWILFGVIALICWIAVLASSSNVLIFIWYLIAGAFCVVFYAFFWGAGTEIVAAISSFVRYGNKKVEIQSSISHVEKKSDMTLSGLERRKENLTKARLILAKCINEIES
jgi:hypothetical protein